MNCVMPSCTRSTIAIAAMLGALVAVPALSAPAEAFAAPTPHAASRCGAHATNAGPSSQFPNRTHQNDCECSCHDNRRDCECNCSGEDDDDGWW